MAPPTIPPSYILVHAVVWECDERQTGNTQTAMINIQFASAMPHVKCVRDRHGECRKGTVMKEGWHHEYASDAEIIVCYVSLYFAIFIHIHSFLPVNASSCRSAVIRMRLSNSWQWTGFLSSGIHFTPRKLHSMSASHRDCFHITCWDLWQWLAHIVCDCR